MLPRHYSIPVHLLDTNPDGKTGEEYPVCSKRVVPEGSSVFLNDHAKLIRYRIRPRVGQSEEVDYLHKEIALELVWSCSSGLAAPQRAMEIMKKTGRDFYKCLI